MRAPSSCLLALAALLLGAASLGNREPGAAWAERHARRVAARAATRLEMARDGGSDELSEEIDIHAPPPSSPLLLPGRKFPLEFDGGGFTIENHVHKRVSAVRVSEVHNAGLGTGLTIWDGAVVLAKYVEHNAAALDLANQRVLELGAGTGVVGLAVAAAGAPSVVLTDLPYTIDNLRANIARNRAAFEGAEVKAHVLDWFNPAQVVVGEPGAATPPPISLILGADVVWVSELIPPLVRTLRVLCEGTTPSPRVLIAHQTRSRAGDALFFGLLAGAGFSVLELPRTAHHPAFNDAAIGIFQLRLLDARSSSCRTVSGSPRTCGTTT